MSKMKACLNKDLFYDFYSRFPDLWLKPNLDYGLERRELWAFSVVYKYDNFMQTKRFGYPKTKNFFNRKIVSRRRH